MILILISFNTKLITIKYVFNNLKIQIIEQVFKSNQFSIENLLWEREKYWQAQLFTNLYGMNNINDLYSTKRKDYRK